MSIQILTQDPILSAMLRLEARRQGFQEEGEPSLLLVDLDTAPLPDVTGEALVIGFSRDPHSVSTDLAKQLSALLSLPFSALDLEAALHAPHQRPSKATPRLIGQELWLNGQKILLSATEARLFKLLYENRNRIVTQKELTALLGESATKTNTPAVYLYRLRRKLCADGVTRIKTVRGIGCRWIGETT